MSTPHNALIPYSTRCRLNLMPVGLVVCCAWHYYVYLFLVYAVCVPLMRLINVVPAITTSHSRSHPTSHTGLLLHTLPLSTATSCAIILDSNTPALDQQHAAYDLVCADATTTTCTQQCMHRQHAVFVHAPRTQTTVNRQCLHAHIMYLLQHTHMTFPHHHRFP